MPNSTPGEAVSQAPHAPASAANSSAASSSAIHASGASASDASVSGAAVTSAPVAEASTAEVPAMDVEGGESTGAEVCEAEPSDLEQLRFLLFGGELQTLLKPPPLEPRAVGAVLADAIAVSQQQSTQLGQATVPTVETAIRHSVQADSNILSEALFPVIGPATRKSVSAAIRNLTQSLNQGLEHSLSPQSFRWRWEAARTGRSFAEVVLLRTLVYQVEQVLLIHRETGLLLQQVMSEQASAQDPDLVSAMLTAIQDFVQDSFNVQAGGSLDTLEFGELTIWIEQGPQAVLACVIRGSAPQDLRGLLQDRLEKVHRNFDAALQTFEGDQATFEGCRPYLEDCVQSQFKGKSSEVKASGPPTLGIIAGCFLLGLVSLCGYRIWAHQRWSNYVELLDQQPGVVVLDAQQRWGTYHLSGLRDALAADPEQLMATQTTLRPEKVKQRWEPYISLDAEIQQVRLRQWLQPPDGVSLAVKDGVMQLTGVASQDWIDSARAIAQSSGGFATLTGWDFSELRSPEQQTLAALQDRIESRVILFPEGKSEPLEPAELEAQRDDLAAWIPLARRLGLSPRVVLRGQADPLGDGDRNLRLSQARAQRIQQLLWTEGIPPEVLRIEALGAVAAPEALVDGQGAQFRSVTFFIEYEGQSKP